ncbi:MAG: bacillithiol biosynthesis deacetylase BshB1 [Candidatus Methylacidiphilales bacterium]
MEKLDILCFAAHPDDTELACSGTILHHIKLGFKVGVVDLTQGELGTRGSAELRAIESANASEILGLSVRDNLRLADGFFQKNRDSLIKIIEKIRQYQPEIILCNAEMDRHTDHGKAADLVSEAAFLSGLIKIETNHIGAKQEAWRPKQIYHYIQDRLTQPDLVVDITPYFDKKMEAIKAFSSQFYDPNNTEPETPISSLDFMKYVEGRAREFGRLINVTFGEGYTVKRPIGSTNLMNQL